MTKLLCLTTLLGVAQLAEAGDLTKVSRYSARDLIQVKSRLRFTTLVIFPSAEEISEASCGDKEFWVIDGKDNVLHVKPTREGLRTNLHVVMRSKAVYSFFVQEVGPKGAADLRVVVGLDDTTRLQREVELLRARAKEAEAESAQKLSALEELRKREVAEHQRAVDKLRESFPARVIDYLGEQKFDFSCPKSKLCPPATFTTPQSTIVLGRLGEKPIFSGLDEAKKHHAEVPFEVRGNVYKLGKRIMTGTITYGGKKVSFGRQ